MAPDPLFRSESLPLNSCFDIWRTQSEISGSFWQLENAYTRRFRHRMAKRQKPRCWINIEERVAQVNDVEATTSFLTPAISNLKTAHDNIDALIRLLLKRVGSV